MKSVNDKEFENVIKLPATERYGYFVRHVADWEEVWALKTANGFVLLADDDGRQLVPVWPHKRFAEACAKAGAEVVAIALDQWMEKWLPGMKNDGRAAAVFPTPEGRGPIVDPDDLQKDLKAECEMYE